MSDLKAYTASDLKAFISSDLKGRGGGSAYDHADCYTNFYMTAEGSFELRKISDDSVIQTAEMDVKEWPKTGRMNLMVGALMNASFSYRYFGYLTGIYGWSYFTENDLLLYHPGWTDWSVTGYVQNTPCDNIYITTESDHVKYEFRFNEDCYRYFGYRYDLTLDGMAMYTSSGSYRILLEFTFDNPLTGQAYVHYLAGNIIIRFYPSTYGVELT